MPRLVLAALLVTAAFLQVAVLSRLTMLLVRPNLVLILVLLWTVHRGGREGAMWAFLVGLLLDGLTLAPFGSHALAMLAVVPIGVACRRSQFSLGLLLPMVGVLLGCLVYDAVLLVLQGETLAGLGLTLTRVALLSGLLSLALTPPLALVTSRLNRWLTHQEDSAGRPRVTRVVGRRR